VLLAAIIAAWLAALVWFWSWWLRPEHVNGAFGMVVSSLVLAVASLTPGFYFLAAWRASEPLYGARLELDPQPPRVAMVVTKAPSEPWEIVRRTLEAMLDQDTALPYDCWLADEQPDAATRRWCRRHGVRISSRHGIAEYHRASWPRRTRCKEGNLAYFYDRWGYRDYDLVCQFDADHAPAPSYLDAVVVVFADPRVGYVAAPSICDANADRSWTARGRLFREASFHGLTQAGQNRGLAPYCIGSHYAVRTAALRQAGGIGPELAEDFTTSFFINAAGWDGAFAIAAPAHGDGPESFADGMLQELQWARSMGAVLFGVTPGHWSRLRWRARLKLAYCVSWYWILCLQMLAGFVLTHGALAAGRPWVDVAILDFASHAALPGLPIVALVVLARARGLLRPTDAKVISWEATLFQLARWPWAAIGLAQAVVAAVTGRTLNFRVTPKGAARPLPLPLRVLLPYAVLSGAGSATLLAVPEPGTAGGYFSFAMLNACVYAAVGLAVVAAHVRENPGMGWRSVRAQVGLFGAVSVLALGSSLLRLGDLVAAGGHGAFLPEVAPGRTQPLAAFLRQPSTVAAAVASLATLVLVLAVRPDRAARTGVYSTASVRPAPASVPPAPEPASSRPAPVRLDPRPARPWATGLGWLAAGSPPGRSGLSASSRWAGPYDRR
jgi:cellulose synthase (UDP-forming)